MNAELDGQVHNRAVGALMGLACGDAVGTTVEFKRPGTFPPMTDMVGGGPFRLPLGAWTDDTSMALCLAESLLDVDGIDLADQLRRYTLWWRSGYLSSTGRCFDIGTTTSAELQRFERTGQPVNPRTSDDSAANGSLMRLAPVAIRWHADPTEVVEMAAESSRSTHAAARPVDACRLLGAMTSALIRGTPADEVLAPSFWHWGNLHPEIEAVARGSWQSKQPPAIRATGYCVDALEAAVWAVGGASSFEETVLRAANLGDDADTTAAIAGQLAGARWGVDDIPQRWRDHVTFAPRIVELAGALYRAGVGSSASVWTHDEFLHAWWVEPGRVLAGEYPGDQNPGLAHEKVNLLVDAGVRTFVDLTTEADRLEPYAAIVSAIAPARGLDLRHRCFGIPDLGVTDGPAYDELVSVIRRESDRGGVYVHCWGGVGRTGTVIGYMLADDGLDYDGIVDRLASLRAGTRKAQRQCPEVASQHDLLRRRAARPVRPIPEPSTGRLSDRYAEAVRFAIESHGTQVRKGTSITYVSHLLSVSALVLEHGGDEDLAIAALLHDAVEDAHDGEGSTMAERIRERFGNRVADVVIGCSDTDVVPKPPWRQRKEAYIEHLRSAADDVLLVSSCDKLHNAHATTIDLREHGRAFWLGGSGVTFNAGPDDQVWYYEALLAAFGERFRDDPSRRRLLAELDRTITELVDLARS